MVSNDRKLAGVIHLADLMKGSSGSVLESLMIRDIPTAPETSLESVLNHDEWLHLDALPVVDSTSLFPGMIRFESIRPMLIKSGHSSTERGNEAVSALGELYRIGLSGVLRSAAGIKPSSKQK